MLNWAEEYSGLIERFERKREPEIEEFRPEKWLTVREMGLAEGHQGGAGGEI